MTYYRVIAPENIWNTVRYYLGDSGEVLLQETKPAGELFVLKSGKTIGALRNGLKKINSDIDIKYLHGSIGSDIEHGRRKSV